MIPDLSTQQFVHRYAGDPAHKIEQRHLQTGADRIIPHGFGGTAVQHALDTGVRYTLMRVMDHGLTPTDVTRVGRHPAQLENRPPVHSALRDPLLSLGEGHINEGAFDINNLHGTLAISW